MSFKSALCTCLSAALAALAALAGISLAAGCGGDECAKAADRWAECIPDSPESPSAGPDTTQQCSGVRLCWSECINSYGDCATLQKSLDANPPDNEYMSCVAICNDMAK